MKPMRYVLEVYEPGSARVTWVVFESSSPFQTIQRDDIINPGVWPNSHAPSKVYKVSEVEHAIYEGNDQITHKLMVYGLEVDSDDL